jgi:hypothetical protein
MARYNPELMGLDEGSTGTKRVFGPRNDTTKATKEEVDTALKQAAEDLGLNPKIEGADVAELFAPIGGGPLSENPSVQDIEYFSKQGFTPGGIPEKYQKLFGNDPDILGWKLEPAEEGGFRLAVARGQGDEDGGLQFQTYGATFKEDANGVPTPFVPKSFGGNDEDGNGNSFGGGIYTASDGKKFNDPDTFALYQAGLEEKKAGRKSAYDLLYSEFKTYGLEALVEPLKSLIEEGVSPSEFTLRLRETDAYKKRFAANAQRVAKGLRALSEAEYIGTEDQYQDVMRRYGMPESYYTKGELGIQSGFEKFLAGDVSAVELEDRIQTAQNRVVNSNPEVAKALKEFYPGISNGDILAYVLDPANAIEQIKRKVTAAEIGGAAIQSGLKTGMTRAEELAAAGITKAQAQQGFQTIAEVAPRGGQLAEIYKQSPYTQTTAEQEVFGLAGATEAAKQRKKLTQLETAAFSGSAGAGAIARDRAGAF